MPAVQEFFDDIIVVAISDTRPAVPVGGWVLEQSLLLTMRFLAHTVPKKQKKNFVIKEAAMLK